MLSRIQLGNPPHVRNYIRKQLKVDIFTMIVQFIAQKLICQEKGCKWGI